MDMVLTTERAELPGLGCCRECLSDDENEFE